MMPSKPLLFLLCVWLALGVGCREMDDFKGTWSGAIVEDESVRKTFDGNTEMEMNVTHITPRALTAQISTCVRVDPQTCTPGLFQQVSLDPVEKARNDDLRDMMYGGEPYAIHLMAAQPNDPLEGPFLVFVSLHSATRVEVRLVRANESYGLFRLTK